MRCLFTALCGILLFSHSLTAQSLTVEEIMNGESFVGFLPEDPVWSPDNETLFFSWNPEGQLLRSTWSWRPKTGTHKLNAEEELARPTANLQWSLNRNKALYAKHGDIFLWDAQQRASRQLTATSAIEYNPFFGRSEQEIIYRNGNNLFLQDLHKGSITQLTDFQKGKKKSDPPPGEQGKWLQQDQEHLSTVLEARHQSQKARKEWDEKTKPKRPLTIYLGEDRVASLSAAPAIQYITWNQVESAKTTATEVPSYVTESGYTDQLQARPYVGHNQDKFTFHCYDRLADTIYQLNIDSLPGIHQKPLFLAEYHADSIPWNPRYSKPKPVIYHGPVWSISGMALLELKSQDHKDRWILVYHPDQNNYQLIDHQHDEAWIGGPGISSWTDEGGDMGWIEDGKSLWFQSEQTGYSHLYTYDLTSGVRKALTSGSFEILHAQLSTDKKTFYISANAEGPAEHHFYHLSVKGGPLKRITTQPGNHEVTLSPDERHLAIRYSFANQPWELFMMDNQPGAQRQQITRSTTPAFQAYLWRVPEIIEVAANDGVEVPGRIYRPEHPNGAAVIFVHGAGYLQNVHRWWSSYFREYMFHNLLCDEGYTVLDLDYRASEGYGRDWRTAIYRHMGGRDLDDQIDGAKFLVDSVGIDPERIGIYGGSYGGFITLMALFQHPGTFACGAALRSVTDWAHYNHPYTANILNTPVEDSLAYRRSSPIYYAEGLQDPLVMLHGMIDTNVHYQDVVRLSQRLIEIGKKDWELAVFPLEDHGFVEASSWQDEYRRIHELFNRYLMPREH